MSSQTTQTDTDMGENRIPQTSSTTFITTSGGLLTEQLASKLRQRQTEQSAVRPETFMMPGGDAPSESELENEIGDAWSTLRERWDELTMSNELFGMSVSDARNKWILQLFRELGFEPVFQRENLEAGGIDANLSHKGWSDGEIGDYGEMQGQTAPILHTVEPGQQIDQKPEGASRGTKSPHDTLQEFLNASGAHDWAVVTNGLTLRILRDYYHTYTRGYIEFDLENMFTNRNYGDFRALYRLCHATRFIKPVVADEKDDVEIPLEQLYQIALSTGIKIGQSLQSNVVSAIETLGTGLLNQEIRGYLQEGGEDEAKEYYQEVLSLVYRLLFLLYAEQRGMMASRESLYTEEYSVTSLREKAETRRDGSDRNTDLWHGLQSTFRLVEEGNDELGVPCYNGMLFDSGNLELVSESECSNDDLLDAIEDLTLVEYEGTRQRISYADLGVEEIGSVYESLLEFTPRLATEAIELEDRKVSNGQFYLDDRGTERKETGSYYTDPGLVQELVQSALKPVVEDRLGDADTATEKENALLDISVCDPASGSGAFLIAANNFLGQRLARIRSGGNYPPEDQIREARRDVLQHCIYAVDLNPMAVELAKVSLWINSAVEDKPLNFLDHHIKCGNSLIGTNSELIEGEFPVDAYETSGGRDWHVGNEIRKRIRSENRERAKGSSESSLREWGIGREYVDIAEQIEEIEEQGAEDIRKKKQLYDELRGSDAYQQEKLAYDVWTAAFYWPMDGSVDEYPSPSTIDKIRRDHNTNERVLQDLTRLTTEIAQKQRFFHWELEFPEVFAGSSPGFDCVLGNPPWDKIKLEEKEWFAGKVPEIADSDSKGHRSRLINDLKESNPTLLEKWELESKRSSQTSKFIRESGRYPLSGSGEINTYPIFTELSRSELASDFGRVGMIVKTGIATDYRTRDLFADLVENKQLCTLYSFVNSEGLFPDVHPNERFCLLTITGDANPISEFELSFYNTNIKMLNNDDRKYTLTPDQIESINPNTKGCPTFKNKRIRDISVKIYERFPVLVDENLGINTWELTYHRLVDMTEDSELFENNTLESLQKRGYKLDETGVFRDEDSTRDAYLPLYEAKYIHQFDHRFGTFDGVPKSSRFNRRASTNTPTDTEKKDADYEITPRYWLRESEFEAIKSGMNWSHNWIFTFRDIARVTSDQRTAMGTIAPFYPLSNKAPALTFSENIAPKQVVIFTTLFTSFSFDFILRQSLSGASVNLYILKQLPMPEPDSLSEYTIVYNKQKYDAAQFLFKRGLKLIWTSHSLDPLGNDVKIESGPYTWDAEERTQLRAEIDAAVSKLYGLNKDEFNYVLESFDILKQKQKEKFGSYRQKDKCLQKYDEMKLLRD
jgi:hypothetical protein